MRRTIVTIALVGISLAACSSSSKSGNATTTTTPGPSSTTTTGAPQITTGTLAPPTTTTTTTIATTVKESVYIDSIDPSAHTITVDPMEFLIGEAATAEYHKVAPSDPGGPPNDHFIVNPTKDHVVLPLQAKAPVLVVKLDAGTTVSVSQASLAAAPNLGIRPFWITIERGSVAEVEEQFVP